MELLTIKGIEDAGNLQKERIVFQCIVDQQLGMILAFKSKKTAPETVSSTPSAVYWFPDRDIKTGDLVILYTKVGENTKKLSAKGHTSHFFYWGKATPLWNKPEDAVVLLAIDNWKARGLEE